MLIYKRISYVFNCKDRIICISYIEIYFDYSKYYAEGIGISIQNSGFIYYLEELKETLWKMEN